MRANSTTLSCGRNCVRVRGTCGAGAQGCASVVLRSPQLAGRRAPQRSATHAPHLAQVVKLNVHVLHQLLDVTHRLAGTCVHGKEGTRNTNAAHATSVRCQLRCHAHPTSRCARTAHPCPRTVDAPARGVAVCRLGHLAADDAIPPSSAPRQRRLQPAAVSAAPDEVLQVVRAAQQL
jgi:hypothetical protein